MDEKNFKTQKIGALKIIKLIKILKITQIRSKSVIFRHFFTILKCI